MQNVMNGSIDTEQPLLKIYSKAAVRNSVLNYSPGMIASLGQTLAQVPQSMQTSGLIT